MDKHSPWEKHPPGSLLWFTRYSWHYTRPMSWWRFALALPGRWRRFRELSEEDLWPGCS